MADTVISVLLSLIYLIFKIQHNHLTISIFKVPATIATGTEAPPKEGRQSKKSKWDKVLFFYSNIPILIINLLYHSSYLIMHGISEVYLFDFKVETDLRLPSTTGLDVILSTSAGGGGYTAFA